MNKQELNLAKEALYQYELVRIKRMEALPSEEIRLSEAYYAKKAELAEQIRDNSLKAKALTRKQKLGIMVAVVLLIATIATACVFGNQIKGFLVGIFDSFVTAKYVEDPSTSYVEYKLNWLPENYKEMSKTNTRTGIQTVYLSNRKRIVFECHPASYINKIIDTQTAEFETFELSDNKIYFNKKNNEYSFYWVNEDATLYLLCDTSIEWSDIEKMIASVESVE